MKKYQKIAVLKGGWSPEREVSLSSGEAAASALTASGYNVTEIDVDRDLAVHLAALNPDAVFNTLHGQWGEDGCVQGLLEVMGIPYTHSGVLASSLAMDKQRAKAIFEEAGIPVAEGYIVPRHEAATTHVMEPPYVVKPNNQGSSVGIYIVQLGDNRPPEALAAKDSQLGEEVLVEKFIPGRELTVAVMGDKPLCVTEIFPTSGFYDYEAKYTVNGSTHKVPADIAQSVRDKAMAMALKTHQALGCRGLSRSDFRFNEQGDGKLYCLEINTQPGLTSTSLAPEQAAYLGISFEQLCDWMIKDASCQR